MQFNINNQLYESSLVLGKNGLFIDANENGLQLTTHRPKDGVIDRIENLIDNYRKELERDLSQRTQSEIKIFFRNITYFTEKITVEGQWEKQSSLYPLGWTMIAVMAGRSLVSSIVNRQQELISQSSLTLLSWTTFYVAKHVYTKAKRYYQIRYIGRVEQKRCEIIRKKLFDICENVLKQTKSTTIKDTTFLLAHKKIEGVQYAGVDRIFTMHKLTLGNMPSQELLHARMIYRDVLTLINKKKSEEKCVFLHGQSLGAGMLSRFFTKFIKRIEPHRQMDHFQFMRYITSHSPQRNKDTNVWDFLKNNQFMIFDSIPKYRDQLVSVSINPLEWSDDESAFSFWVRNTSVDCSFVDYAAKAIKQHATHRKGAKAVIRERFLELADTLNNKRNGFGNLVVICIPRKALENSVSCIGYHSYAFGIPMNIFRTEKIADLASQDWASSEPCQARLLANQLVPENNIEIYHFNTLSPVENRQCDAILDSLVSQVIE